MYCPVSYAPFPWLEHAFGEYGVRETRGRRTTPNIVYILWDDQPFGAYGIPYTGLSNARPETKAIAEQVRRNLEALPFDVREYLEFEVPGGKLDPDFGR